MLATTLPALLAAALALLSLASSVSTVDLTLTADTPIVVAPSDLRDGAFAHALRDLQRDWYAVLGSPPVILSRAPAAGLAVALGSAGRAALAPGDRCAATNEAHCVVLRGGRLLVATGAPGSLGAVYGIYALSEWLGVVPLHAFAELRTPPRRAAVSVPAALALRYEPTGWAQRAVFLNDEDLSAGFGADPLGDGIGAESYNRIYEALLRLKANGVISGTANFPDQRGGTSLAAKRGLQLLQHHVTPVGLNVMRWPNAPVAEGGAVGFSDGGAPFSFLNAPEVLEHAWGSSIDALLSALPAGSNVTSSVMWTVGLRGLNDYAWWLGSSGDARVANATLRGEVIGEAMAAQQRLLRLRDPKAQAIAYMWSEMLALWEAGSLKLPEGTTIVFADDGSGNIHGLTNVTPGAGLYYHVSDRANQLTEWNPVSRVLSQLSAFLAKAKPTDDGLASVFILNASDLKPYLLSLSAAMAFAFDPAGTGTDAAAFTRRWSDRHYGKESGAAVAAVHDSFANVSATALSDYAIVIAVQNLANSILQLVQTGRNFSSLKASAESIEASGAATAAAWAALSVQSEVVMLKLEPRTRQMFAGHALAQSYLLGNGSVALSKLASAALAPTAAASAAAVGEAVAPMERALAGLRLAEGQSWRGLFAHDRLDDFQHSRRLLMQLRAALTATPLPPVRPICSCTGGVKSCSGSVPYARCPDMFANQLPPQYDASAYPQLYRSSNASRNFDGVVRGGCSEACRTTPSGGIAHGTTSSTMWLALAAGARGTIRYTLDGSAPTVASALYAAGALLPLSRNTTLSAKAFGVADGVATPISVWRYFVSEQLSSLRLKADDAGCAIDTYSDSGGKCEACPVGSITEVWRQIGPSGLSSKPRGAKEVARCKEGSLSCGRHVNAVNSQGGYQCHPQHTIPVATHSKDVIMKYSLEECKVRCRRTKDCAGISYATNIPDRNCDTCPELLADFFSVSTCQLCSSTTLVGVPTTFNTMWKRASTNATAADDCKCSSGSFMVMATAKAAQGDVKPLRCQACVEGTSTNFGSQRAVNTLSQKLDVKNTPCRACPYVPRCLKGGRCTPGSGGPLCVVCRRRDHTVPRGMLAHASSSCGVAPASWRSRASSRSTSRM